MTASDPTVTKYVVLFARSSVGLIVSVLPENVRFEVLVAAS